MAVYTKISSDQLQSLLTLLKRGRLRHFSGVADGIENTTYIVNTLTVEGQEESWVLTIFEKNNPQQVQFSAGLIERLYNTGLPVPLLAKDHQNNVIHSIAGKDAFLASKSPGVHPEGVGIEHCAAIGEFLGKMHNSGSDFSLYKANPYDLRWAEAAVDSLVTSHFFEDRTFIDGQLIRHRQLRKSSKTLPVGPIHADLFRDNTLFNGIALTAVIDFQSACVDWLLLDVAIAVNDWASRDDGEIDHLRADALLGAYQCYRQFTKIEQENWQSVLCVAATQFWLSRLLTQQRYSNNLPELTGRSDKDPAVYARILSCRENGVTPLPA